MSEQDERPTTHRAGLFDIRNIIGALLALYGVVLLVVGLVDTTAQDLSRSGGIHANAWVGAVLVVVGALFLVWARLRPIVVDEEELARDRADGTVE